MAKIASELNPTKLSHVLNKISDLAVDKVIQTNGIKGAIKNLLEEEFGERFEEESFDYPVAVRVSQKTASRIEYYQSRMGISKTTSCGSCSMTV